MNRKLLAPLVVCLLLLAAGTVVLVTAEETGGFSIPWWTVDGGGGTSYGGSYSLSGTAGQPDNIQMTGGAYTLESGFWHSRIQGISPVTQKSYLPIINR